MPQAESGKSGHAKQFIKKQAPLGVTEILKESRSLLLDSTLEVKWGWGGDALRQPRGLFRRQRNESLPGSDNLVGNAIKAGDGARFRHDWTGPTYPIVCSWPAIKRTTCTQRTGSLYCLADSEMSKTRFLP